jgi:uncharacterized membrane protein YdjX (TVP38/TMEM64 family)
VPFNLQNYLDGLTGIRFASHLLASRAAMLPGAVPCVMLGHAGRAGLVSAGGRARTPAGWDRLGVGLVATLALAASLARLPRRALATDGNPSGGPPAHSAPGPETASKG